MTESTISSSKKKMMLLVSLKERKWKKRKCWHNKRGWQLWGSFSTMKYKTKSNKQSWMCLPSRSPVRIAPPLWTSLHFLGSLLMGLVTTPHYSLWELLRKTKTPKILRAKVQTRLKIQLKTWESIKRKRSVRKFYSFKIEL
jgi:hypothetical protein